MFRSTLIRLAFASLLVVGFTASAAAEDHAVDADGIRSAMRERLTAIKLCYEAALAKDPSLQGSVVVHFDINADGSIANLALDEDGLPSPACADCLLAALGTLRFAPRPATAEVVSVSYPLRFAAE